LPVTSSTLVVDLTTVAGSDIWGAVAVIEANVPGGIVAFPGEGGVRLGWKFSLSGGAGRFELPNTDQATANLDGPFQYKVTIDIPAGVGQVARKLPPIYVDLPTGTPEVYLADCVAASQVPTSPAATSPVFVRRFDATTQTWPPRPPGGSSITGFWFGGDEEHPPPAQALVDLWIRDAAPASGGEDPDYPQVPGWLRTSANTGLAAVGTTREMLTAHTDPWTVYEPSWSGPNLQGDFYRKIFTADQRLGIGPGSTFTECILEGHAGNQAWITLHGDGIRFKDCDINHASVDGSEGARIVLWAVSDEVALGSPGVERPKFHLDNVKITGGTVGIYHAGNLGGEINDVYAYDQMPESGYEQHRDGFTSRGATADNPVILRRSRFVCDQLNTTGALFLQATYGGVVDGIEAYDCLFEGAGYPLTLEHTRNLKLVRVRVKLSGDAWGPAIGQPANTYAEWDDVTLWADDPDNDYRGAAIPQPF